MVDPNGVEIGTMQNKRASRRRLVAIRASVSGADGGPAFTCVVRDASDQGCKLVMGTSRSLPDRVRLTIGGLAHPIDGEVVWRNGKEAGIRFVRRDAAEAVEELVTRAPD